MNKKFQDLAAPIDIPEEEDAGFSEVPAGFLPIETNWFDRVFISVVLWVALSLIWFRLMEPLGFSIWISNAIALVIAGVILTKG